VGNLTFESWRCHFRGQDKDEDILKEFKTTPISASPRSFSLARRTALSPRKCRDVPFAITLTHYPISSLLPSQAHCALSRAYARPPDLPPSDISPSDKEWYKHITVITTISSSVFACSSSSSHLHSHHYRCPVHSRSYISTNVHTQTE
jgi:hypothetical protein